jgi:hypothetical protein
VRRSNRRTARRLIPRSAARSITILSSIAEKLGEWKIVVPSPTHGEVTDWLGERWLNVPAVFLQQSFTRYLKNRASTLEKWMVGILLEKWTVEIRLENRLWVAVALFEFLQELG